ncbi:hypothetical protein FocnCong_v004102 [Fusarium oxysporum f. sp. conglutinans]|nr:hypothetical protein FocnCong_v004102 [Fusarium oxysporum f. sp. conglutinans]
MTRQITMRVLSSFLEMMTANVEGREKAEMTQTSPYLSLLTARAVENDEFKDSLWSAGINADELGFANGMRKSPDLEGLPDNVVLLITAIELVDFQMWKTLYKGAVWIGLTSLPMNALSW